MALALTPISGAASAAKTGGVSTAMETSAWIASVAMRANIGEPPGWGGQCCRAAILRQPDRRHIGNYRFRRRKIVCGGFADHILYVVVTDLRTYRIQRGTMETIWTQELVTQLSAL